MMHYSHQMRFTFSTATHQHDRTAIAVFSNRFQCLDDVSSRICDFQKFIWRFVNSSLRITTMQSNSRSGHIFALEFLSER